MPAVGGRKSIYALKQEEHNERGPTNLQTYKPTNLQTYKPCKPLIALIAALALFFCAACSDGSDDSDSDTSGGGTDNSPAYYGTYAPTDDLINTLNDSLDGWANFESADDLSLTISDTIALTVVQDYSSLGLGDLTITIPGTYELDGSDDDITFTFTLDYDNVTITGVEDANASYIIYIMQAIGDEILKQFNPATYSDGALYDSDNNKIFEKAAAEE